MDCTYLSIQEKFTIMMQYKFLPLLALLIVNVSIGFGQVPYLDWGTYFAGQRTSVHFVKVDTFSQSIVIAGVTADTSGVATLGAHKENMGEVVVPEIAPNLMLFWDWDVFVAKFDMAGSLLWATYYGGLKKERLSGLDIDYLGNIYICGTTYSSEGIATEGAHQSSVVFPTDSSYVPFLAKFSPSGTLLWGTYYGLPSGDNEKNNFVVALAVDHTGDVYIGSGTGNATGIATSGSYQPELNGLNDGFIAKFDGAGNRLWGTYYGTNNDIDSPSFYAEGITSLAIDQNNNLIVAGNVYYENDDLGTVGTYLPIPPSGTDSTVHFLAKFTPDGARLWHTYLDKSFKVMLNGIVTDSIGGIYLYGTASYSEEEITTPGVHQEEYGGGDYDHALMRFTSDGNKDWATYFGGEGSENWTISALDETAILGRYISYSTLDGGSIYTAAVTNSLSGIDNGCGYETTTPYKRGYIAKFALDGTLKYSGYFDEGIYSIDAYADKNAKQEMVICTRPTFDGLATPGSYQDNMAGLLRSSYVAKFYERCPLEYVYISYDNINLLADEGFDFYTWYHNGIEVGSTETGEYPIGGDTTGYWYCKARVCGCEYISDTIYFSGLGIPHPTENVAWSPYPNPATDELTLDFGRSYTISEATDLMIVDVLGRRVYQRRINKGVYQSISVPVDALPRGVYILRLGVSGIRFVKR